MKEKEEIGDKKFKQYLRKNKMSIFDDENSGEDLDENSEEINPNDPVYTFLLETLSQKLLILKIYIETLSNVYKTFPEKSNLKDSFESYIVDLMKMSKKTFSEIDDLTGEI